MVKVKIQGEQAAAVVGDRTRPAQSILFKNYGYSAHIILFQYLDVFLRSYLVGY